MPMDKQRTNTKFCVKLGKSATETYILIQQVYSDEVSLCMCLNGIHVFMMDGRQWEVMPDLANHPPHALPRTLRKSKIFATKSLHHHTNVVKGAEDLKDGLSQNSA
jgi:hypothetical protein